MESPQQQEHAGAAAGFVAFRLGGETCAVELGAVREIVRVPPLVSLPLSPPAVEGLANLRGHVLPVINGSRALGVPAASRGDQARIIVLGGSAGCGLLVDEVDGLIEGNPETLEGVQENDGRQFVAGTLHAGDRLVMLLDLPSLLAREIQQFPAADAALLPGDVSLPDVEAEEEGEAYLTFVAAGQEYGVAVDRVREIGRLPTEWSRIPHAAPHLLGVAPLRGRLLPLVDLRTLFGLPAAGEHDRRRVLVMDAGGPAVGLVVDRVSGVLRAGQEPDDLPPLWERPEDADLQGMLCLSGGSRLVAVVAADRLLRQVLAELETGAEAMPEEPMPSRDQPLAEEEGETLVIFLLAGQEFALPVGAVREIVRVPEQLSRVPGAGDFVEGMLNLRGQVLPVLDQRARLGMPGRERTDHQRILVIEAGGVSAGLAVDAVRDVLDVARSTLGPAPALGEDSARPVRQVANLTAEGRMILVLDPDELLRGMEPVPAAGEEKP